MDWSKVDSALAAVLDSGGGRAAGPLTVFVHTQGTGADLAYLAALDITVGEPGDVLSATLAAEDVDGLTDQPWVRSVRLSMPLRPIGGP